MTDQNEAVPEGFSEEDLLLGKKACRYIDILSTSALLACAGIAAFVFLNVPWNTFHSDAGKYGGNARVALYILGTSMVLLCVWGQWVLAGQILEDGFTARWRWEE